MIVTTRGKGVSSSIDRLKEEIPVQEVSHAGIASAEEGDLPLRERMRFLEGGEEYRVLSTKKPC